MTLAERDLEALILGNEAFDELERAMELFCPFEAIGMVDQEIRHGHYLRYILDPQRPHGFGADCLRALMSAAADSLSGYDASAVHPLDVHLMELDSAIVPQREYKSIDILIEVPIEKVIVAIELKIEASEHTGQLARYKKVVETDWPTDDGWRHIFLFLTKRGEDPSEEDGIGWNSLPLEYLLLSLDRVLARGNGTPEARSLLASYLAMLRRHHLTDQRLEGLARRLWAQHKEVLDFLAARKPDAISDILGAILEDQVAFAAQLSELSDQKIEADHSTRAYVRFAIPAWDDAPGMLSGTGWAPNSSRLFLFEFYRGGKGTIRCQFQLGPGDNLTREALFEAIKQEDGDTGWAGGLTPMWRQFASRILIKAPDEVDFDVSEKVAQVLEIAGAFLKSHLPPYNRAVARLRPPKIGEETSV